MSRLAVDVLLATAAALGLGIPLLYQMRASRQLALELQRRELTDALTGLGTRQALLESLGVCVRAGGEWLVALLTLDGLKRYDEIYGSESGDAVVARVGGRLGAALGRDGRAYRLGGGRFAIVVRAGGDGGRARLEAAVAALREEGEGFRLEPTVGTALLPGDGAVPDQVLGVASRRLVATRVARDAEGTPSPAELIDRAVERRRVAVTQGRPSLDALTRAVCARLRLDGDAAARALLAAELRPLGKLPIPREILADPGRPSGAEWAFIERHPAVGERIVEVTIGAADVARIVRSSFERFDGGGYPDGLAGEAIPVEARVAAVCGAYEAMLAPAAWRPARSRAEAVGELRAGAGSQFDPAVVAAFTDALAEQLPAEEGVALGAQPVGPPPLPPPRRRRRGWAARLGLLAGLVLLVAPAGAAVQATDVVRPRPGASPRLAVPSADPQLVFGTGTAAETSARAIAVARWGGSVPCGGAVAVGWLALTPGVNAIATWSNPVSQYGAPQDNAGCAVTFNSQIAFTWAMYCTIVVHEFGHLAGHPHSADPADLMAAYYSVPSPECATAPVPAGAEGPVRSAGSSPAAGLLVAGSSTSTSTGRHLSARARHRHAPLIPEIPALQVLALVLYLAGAALLLTWWHRGARRARATLTAPVAGMVAAHSPAAVAGLVALGLATFLEVLVILLGR